MSKIVTIHSFRRGTGKSHITANIATLIAIQGYRVGVLDFNFVSPSMHILFSVPEEAFQSTLNDYIWGECEIQQAAYDLTPYLQRRHPIRGRLFLVPASTRPKDIARILRGGYYLNLLVDACFDLLNTLALDFVMIDTPAGLHEDAQLAMAVSDTLVTILRPDRQDFQGTGIIVDVARKLGIPQVMLVVNEVPALWEAESVKLEVEQAYRCGVSAVLPHTEALTLLASNGVFALHHPEHPLTADLLQITQNLCLG